MDMMEENMIRHDVGLNVRPDKNDGGVEVIPNATCIPPPATQDALAYLNSITQDDLQSILFTDALVTTSDTGKELGEFSVSIELARHSGQDCLLIHANSHGALDNVPMGTSVTAYVSKNLQTLEQQHHEYVKLEDHHLDKKTFLTLQDGHYIVNKVVMQGEQVQRTAQTYGLNSMKGFISEGSNLLLERVMAKKGIPDNMCFLSFDSEANLCCATYKHLEERSQKVGDEEVIVTGIERTVQSSTDLPTTWQTYFLQDGHLGSRVQVGSPVTMRLLQLPAINLEDEKRQQHDVSRKPLNWEEDMQLYSKFLDKKEELKGDHATYMRHHPELKALLADFLQFLLLRKPEDVVAFAADYFASFSPTTKIGSSYATSNEPRYIPRPNSPFKKRQEDAKGTSS
ncbi:ciliogenesis-associated TTC17-interacting protein-like isoform X3 [Patiria miniata]|uniref:Ciliogenesis-associated TTC17-interacting protein n=1 Tax=Patiria miniata TaxID=46514 RepID=A0A913Z092_PATMI|nr:ciliogenesis-associated TTC17-interacting protein-like isoform X3 [Patiria miniata]